jgi:hypothetical protein
MKNEERKLEKKQPYVEPKVLATYEKEELEETIKTQGNGVSTFDTGVG